VTAFVPFFLRVYDVIWRRFKISPSQDQIQDQLSFSQRQGKPKLGLNQLNLAMGDHIQARGTHINVTKPQKVNISCQGPLRDKMIDYKEGTTSLLAKISNSKDILNIREAKLHLSFKCFKPGRGNSRGLGKPQRSSFCMK